MQGKDIFEVYISPRICVSWAKIDNQWDYPFDKAAMRLAGETEASLLVDVATDF